MEDKLSAPAINEIVALVKESEPTTVIDGFTYWNKNGQRVEEPTLKSLVVNSLDSAVEYLKTQFTKEFKGVIVVSSPKQVDIYGIPNGQLNRDYHLQAHANCPQYPFDKYLTVEEFLIKLNTCFMEGGSREMITALLARVAENEVIERSDNGLSQELRVSSGIATVENQKIPNPADLQPYRTFHEVEQPVSKFILRAKKGREGVEVALFEADGSAWYPEAIRNVRNYLKNNLPDFNII